MGGKKKSTTQTYKPAGYVEDAAKRAIGLGQSIGSQKYQAYGGQRVAGLSQNEEMGMRMARDTAGISTPYYEEAAGLARSGAQSWTDLTQAERDQYMNPYIKGALDPAAREIRQEGARTAMELDSRASSMDAFGGSRAALMRSENREKTLQSVKDLYGEGYARAYESAVGIWGDEKTREMTASGRLMDLGTAFQNAAQTDINALMATGATDRGIQQAMLDFDYQQFIEQRDWGFRQLGGLIAALEGTKGSTTTTQSTTSKESGGGVAQALGVAATLIGAFYTGGASLAATGAAGAGGTGAAAATAVTSDKRLKEKITYLFTHMGRRFYSWWWNAEANALGLAGYSVGVIAQENPDISLEGPHGYLMVDYSKLREEKA